MPSNTPSNEATRPGGHRERVEVPNDQMGSDMSSSTECGRPATESATGTPKATPASPVRHRHVTVSEFARPAWAVYSAGVDDAEATVEHVAAIDVRDTFLASEEPTTLRLAVNDCMVVDADGSIMVERSEPSIEFNEGVLSLAASARMARTMVKLVADAVGDGNPWLAAGAVSLLADMDRFVTLVEDETGRAATEQEIGR